MRPNEGREVIDLFVTKGATLRPVRRAEAERFLAERGFRLDPQSGLLVSNRYKGIDLIIDYAGEGDEAPVNKFILGGRRPTREAAVTLARSWLPSGCENVKKMLSSPTPQARYSEETHCPDISSEDVHTVTVTVFQSDGVWIAVLKIQLGVVLTIGDSSLPIRCTGGASVFVDESPIRVESALGRLWR
jgi:hypothetical protein